MTAVLLYKSSHQGLKAPSVPNPIPLESCFWAAIRAEVLPSSSFPSPFPLQKQLKYFAQKVFLLGPAHLFHHGQGKV